MSCHVNSLQSRSESSLFGPTAHTSNRTNGPKGIFRSLERLAPGTALRLAGDPPHIVLLCATVVALKDLTLLCFLKGGKKKPTRFF